MRTRAAAIPEGTHLPISVRRLARHGQRQEGRERLSAHRCDIAQPPRKAAQSNELRRIPVAPKMDVFDAEVGRYQHLVARRNAQDGAVVPNAGRH